MKKKLQEKLFSKYPKIFRQKDLPMTETAMCWGIDAGDGWYWLLDQLCEALQGYVDNNKISQLEATQVKEKWGALRFYTNFSNGQISGMIRLAESMSAHICENCGSTDNVKCEGENWVRTRCKNCKEIK